MYDVVKAIIYRGGLFLLQLRDNDPSILYPNTWSFFGGGVDDEESKDNALYRELEEELGWQPEKIECLYESKNEKLNCKTTYYLLRCDVPSDKLILGEGQAMDWFSSEEILALSNTPGEIKSIINKVTRHLKKS
jgi:8-oxo-dGTP diphosphatase